MESQLIVSEIIKAVSSNLGREAIYRRVNSREQYFVLDLAFSYFQKADRNRRNDYRSGYFYYRNDNDDYLLFVLAHSPVMMSFFKNNFNFNIFKDIIISTNQYRVDNYLRIKRDGRQEVIRGKDLKEFLCIIDTIEEAGFANSVFAKSVTGKTGLGNIFGLRLASNINIDIIHEVIEKSWDLFLWLYPSKPLFTRNSSLNRSMHEIDKKCEFCKIGNLPESICNSSCSGQIEGAHIKPYKDGGSDKLSNGVWLCSFHHRITEGKLTGTRGIDSLNVIFKE